MGLFERYLSVWVGLCIIAGLILGNIVPDLFQLIASMEVAHVNIPVALFIWVMIYPMMVQVDFSSIKDVGKKPKGLALTLVINWLIKPFSMAALGWLFFRVLFADWVDPQTASEYIAGMILLGVAPCTAMVFVWSQLTKGDANYTLAQVSINDVIMIFAFAPLAARNLIYTFHFYEPKNFTHQGAYWGWPMWVSFSGFPYPSSPEAVAAPLQRAAPDVQPHLAHYGDERWNRARLAHALDRASEWARRHGVPIWCGEFGVYRANAAPAHRRAWLNDVTGLMQARGIGWALWDYAGPFGLTQGARPPRELDTDMAAAMGLRTVQP